jgi:hypothetical protein
MELGRAPRKNADGPQSVQAIEPSCMLLIID